MKFESSKTNSGKSTYLILKNKKISYDEANDRIDKAADWLSTNGVKIGTKVVLSLSNEWDTTTLFMALLKMGATSILIDPRFKLSKSQATIDRVLPDLVIADQALVKGLVLQCKSVGLTEEVIKNTLSKLLGKKKSSESSGNTLGDQLEKCNGYGDYPEVDMEDVAYILFTSGSSAQPKGVKISYKNLVTHLNTLEKVYELDNNSNVLNILPIYHTDGIIQGPILTYFAGCTLVRPFDFEIGKVQELFDGIYKYRISHFLTVPTMLDILLKFSAGYEDSFKTDDFRHIISSASILEKEIWHAFESKFGVSITNVFGLTETVAGGLFCGPEELTKRIGSIGKPIDCEVKIINDKGEEIITSNEVGELFMRGEHIAKEYLGTGAILDNEGWFATGDLAYRDCDDFYYIHGRKSNVIISGGVNISPEEIQEVINSSGYVVESYVFGVKDETWGEKLEAAIVSTEGTGTNHLDNLKAYLSEHLEANKIPTQFHCIQQIPKTLSGKLDKKTLLTQLETTRGNNNSTDIKEGIIMIASNSFNIPKNSIDIYTHSKSIDGWTSLNHLDFIVSLERTYQIKFSTTEIMNVGTIQDAIDITIDKLN